MSTPTSNPVEKEVEDWWRTEIVEMAPGTIRFRGYAVEDLIGNVGFAEMIWLMLRGELPTKGQAALFEFALTAGVDHGPQAPSIAVARMAATCGVGLNNAMASAVNVLGDVHGGAGEQAAVIYRAIRDDWRRGEEPVEAAVDRALDRFFAEGNKFFPGFGHRFHPVDPRSPRLLALADAAVKAGDISGDFVAIGRAIEASLETRKGKRIPMNIDGATGVVYSELDFPPPLARGLFCLARSVGILAHAWEQSCQGGRNKGPIPRRMTWTYDGVGPRKVP